MQVKQQNKLKKVSNVQKNFMYECEVCYEDYDNDKHIPMIICSNYHAICKQCVKSNLFKMEYNKNKNPTGRYLCFKCSQIINKDFIRQHNILKEVCNYIDKIKQRDQQNRKTFYNYVGTMGMNLIAMRQDYDTIEKNNIILKKQNQLLVKQNQQLKNKFIRIEKASGSLQQLQKIMRKVDIIKEQQQQQKIKLQSIKDQIKRLSNQLETHRNQKLTQLKQLFQVKAQINQINQLIKSQSIRSKELLEQNQGAINLRQYLEQEINNLKNEKKKIQQENNYKKIKMNQSLKIMQKYWQNLLNNKQQSNTYPNLLNKQNQSNKQNEKVIKEKQKVQQIKNTSIPLNKSKSYQYKIKSIQQSKSNQFINDSIFFEDNNSDHQQRQLKKIQQKVIKQLHNIQYFDHSQKSIKNFHIQNSTATLIRPKLSNFVHISSDYGFTQVNNNSQGKQIKQHSFTIRIKQLNSPNIMIGLMTSQLKNKKNIYNRKGFYGIDGWGKIWINGQSQQSKFKIKQNDQIIVRLNKQSHTIAWSKYKQKNQQIHRLAQDMWNKTLYPVILLIQDGDTFQVLQVI